jgi:putative Mn2+ efflux pump MntP
MTFAPALEQLLTSVGLAMDCTAIAVAYGLARRGRPGSVEVRLCLAFGLFQALLFGLGWAAGSRFRDALGRWDHWIIFAILAGIGGKMLWESFRGENEARDWNLTWGAILLLALAASVDALAVGLGFSLAGSGLLLPSLLIGAASFLLPLLGYHGGSRFGGRLGDWAERLGGTVLIGIGAKILAEHLARGI